MWHTDGGVSSHQQQLSPPQGRAKAADLLNKVAATQASENVETDNAEIIH